MADERDRRRVAHRDHAADRVRTRTPVIGVPVRQKARTLEPAFRPLPEPSDFDEPTPVEALIGHMAERGVIVTRDLRLAVEEILEHTRHVEQRSARRQSAPAPTRGARLLGIAKWLGPLLAAIVGAIYAAGVRHGVAESAAAERASDRRQLDQLITAVRRLELDISNIRGAMRTPQGEDRTP